MTDRARTLDRLATERFDLLVIGAGILGSRIAYDAARSGLRVALVDAGDVGGATSSASSKLVHGGFQYLARGQVGLVRRAPHERRELMTRIAPHLVRPLPILLAIDKDGSFPRPLLRGALVLYSLLSGQRERPPRLLDAAHAGTLVPPLAARDGRVYACLPEAQTHDGRLVLATCLAAAGAGAVIANHLRVVDFVHEGIRATGAVANSTLGEGSLRVRARALVNATGPWVDRVRQLEDPHCRPLVRLSKGTHLLLTLDHAWQAGVAVSLDRARLTFAVRGRACC
jgi:glycerol-3-phosphate dehydrogenase